MSNNILLIIWIGIVAILYSQFNVNQNEYISGQKKCRIKWFYAILAFIPFIWAAGVRVSFIDTESYIASFHNMPGSFGEYGNFIENVKKDKGYFTISFLIKCIFGDNSAIYLTIIALIQGICLVSVYRKYSSSYIMSLFIFLASTDYLSWMQNGIRQFTAVAIIFAAYPLFVRKNIFL